MCSRDTREASGGVSGVAVKKGVSGLLRRNSLAVKDSEVSRLLAVEASRQSDTINLIASENYASRAVLEAQGSLLTNKYAEGYPGRRYYGGCAEIDKVEALAVKRARELFGAAHANVQSHSGSQANMAAYMALLELGDTVLGMSLSHGGHLTHGAPVSFSGKWYRCVPYGVDPDTERLDYDEIGKLCLKHRPKAIVVGASAYSRIIDFARFRQIADTVGACLIVDMAHIAGLIAAGVHPSPVPHAEVVSSTTHKTLRGPRGGFILCRERFAPAIDSAVFPGTQGGPLMHVIAAKAVAFHEAGQPEFVAYQQAVVANARTLAAELQQDGLRLVSGGTENHLMLVDLTRVGITGRTAEEALEAAGILVNRNTIPFDKQPPRITSGIRLGTPSVTTRGFGAEEIKLLASLIRRVLSRPDDTRLQARVRDEVLDVCRKFPVPGAEL